MPKKFFDIIPPHLVPDFEKKLKSLVGEKKTKKKIKKDGKKKKPTRLKGILITAGIFVLLVIIYLYFKLPSLNVVIWPKTEDVAFTEQILADSSLKEIDLQNKTIPAKFISEEKETWQEFSATGSSAKEGMAQGTIKVYNSYNPPVSIALKAGTHFLSDSGKYFISAGKISIPPAQKNNGKIVPSYVEIKVSAVESGDEYNIGPAKFSVPKLAGTAFYYSVYAESSAAMTGGFKSTAKKVTAEDIDDATNALSQKVFSDTEQLLRDKASELGLILYSDAIKKDVIENSCAVKAEAEVDKFNCKIKVNFTALVFKESDFKKLAEGYIVSQAKEPRTVLETSLVLDYTLNTIDLKAGKMVLDANISAKTYPTVDKNELLSVLPGKTSSQISNIIYEKLNQQVERLSIKLWPFWVKKCPGNQKRIKIELNFGQ
jgi:hypothetical protein